MSLNWIRRITKSTLNVGFVFNLAYPKNVKLVFGVSSGSLKGLKLLVFMNQKLEVLTMKFLSYGQGICNLMKLRSCWYRLGGSQFCLFIS